VAEAAAAGRRLVEVVDQGDTDAPALVAAFRALVEDGAFARLADGSPAADIACLCGPRRR
jgi:hypothetical protein